MTQSVRVALAAAWRNAAPPRLAEQHSGKPRAGAGRLGSKRGRNQA